jgi:pantetheine-phosphate adenylyltransferase
MFALSADPCTHGHSSVLREAIRRQNGRVLFGIANDPKKNYAFAQWERLRLAQASLPDTGWRDVRLVSGSLARWMVRNGIRTLYRGQRNAIDQAAEDTLKFYYRQEFPGIDIQRIQAEPGSPYSEISSSGVKECLKVGHDISPFVSSRVKQALESRIVGQYPVCVTGEMGAGKSAFSCEVVRYARQIGISATYVDFDSIADDIYSSLADPYYADVRKNLREAFGDDIFDENGWIRIPELSRMFREDPARRPVLDSIMRDPMIFRYRDMIQGKKGLILVDGALLAESGLTHLGNHHIVLMGAPQETRVERVIARYAARGRNMTRDGVLAMFAAQKDYAGKCALIQDQIRSEKNGSLLERDNSQSLPSPELSLRQILRSVDVFGEIRAGLVLRNLGMSEVDAAVTVQELKKKHEEPHRFYHTWEHVVEMLDRLFECQISGGLFDHPFGVLGTAILFHDSVYEVDPTYYRDNETRSASYAESILLSRGVQRAAVKQIYGAIQSTAHSSDRANDFRDPVADILHDFDLAILAAVLERYARYVSDLMEEFGVYSGEVFRKKRIEFLEGLLAKGDALYRTEYGRAAFLVAARRNVSEELLQLKVLG